MLRCWTDWLKSICDGVAAALAKWEPITSPPGGYRPFKFVEYIPNDT